MTKSGSAFSEDGAAEAWRKAAPGRTAYLAVPTARLFALARIRAGDRVLVVGGGTGDEAIVAARAAGSTGEVILTDLSPGMVKEARVALTEAGLSRVRCLLMDAQDLDFPADRFDVVIARNVLMFLPDLQVGLSEMRRVLKPGGRLVGTTWSSRKHNPRLSIPIDAAAAVGVVVPPRATLRLALSLNRPDRLLAALRRAGFSDPLVEKATAVARPDDWDSFLLDVRHHGGTREVARLVPERDLDRFWRSLDRRFLKHRPSGELNGEQLVLAGTALPRRAGKSL